MSLDCANERKFPCKHIKHTHTQSITIKRKLKIDAPLRGQAQQNQRTKKVEKRIWPEANTKINMKKAAYMFNNIETQRAMSSLVVFTLVTHIFLQSIIKVSALGELIIYIDKQKTSWKLNRQILCVKFKQLTLPIPNSIIDSPISRARAHHWQARLTACVRVAWRRRVPLFAYASQKTTMMNACKCQVLPTKRSPAWKGATGKLQTSWVSFGLISELARFFYYILADRHHRSTTLSS